MINPINFMENYENIVLSILFQYKVEFFAAFVLLFVGRKIYRANRGGRYTRIGLVMSPLLYLAFTGFTFYGLNLEGLLICTIAFAFGLGLSSALKNQLFFFEKKGQLYYKRSAFTVLGWTGAFVLRLYLFIFYDITVGLLLSIILSYITGLFTGEAFQIAIQKRMFDRKNLQEAADIKVESMQHGQ